MKETPRTPEDTRWMDLETAALLVAMAWRESMALVEQDRVESGSPFIDPEDGIAHYDAAHWTMWFLGHFEAAVHLMFRLRFGEPYQPDSTVNLAFLMERVAGKILPPGTRMPS